MIYISIDESGSMTVEHATETKNRWFTIALVVLKKPKALRRAFKRWIVNNNERLQALDKNNKMFDETGKFKELKSSLLRYPDKIELLNFLCQNDYFEVIFVDVDNTKVADYFYESTARAFNYILGLTLRRYLNSGVLKRDDYYLYIDERNTKVRSRASLEDYLNTVLKLDYNLIDSLQVEYYESHANYFVQIADFFTNLRYSQKFNKKYNKYFTEYRAKGYFHCDFIFPIGNNHIL